MRSRPAQHLRTLARTYAIGLGVELKDPEFWGLLLIGACLLFNAH